LTTSVAVSLQEWQTLGPESGSGPLSGLSLSSHPEARRFAAELSESKRLEVLELSQGIELRSFAHVGRIQLGPVTVTVHPKLRGAPLHRLLRYAYGLRDLSLFSTLQYGTAEHAFQEVLIEQLAAEVAELISRGLHREYERTTAALQSPRGKLDFTAYLRNAGVARAELPCVHHPRLTDTLLNTTVLAGLFFAATLAEDIELRSRLRRHAELFEYAGTRPILDRTLLQSARRHLDRRTTAYAPILTLLELLWESAGLSLDQSSEELRLPGALFDMNRFFQRLISRFLHENLSGYEVKDEFRLQNVFDYEPDDNPLGRRAPTLRPDFVIQAEQKTVAVLDAKYRDLWELPLPRDMLYQLSLYAMSFRDCREATIVYPTLSSNAEEQRIRINDPLFGEGRAHVAVRPVNLHRLDQLIRDPDDVALNRQRAEFARLLATS